MFPFCIIVYCCTLPPRPDWLPFSSSFLCGLFRVLAVHFFLAVSLRLLLLLGLFLFLFHSFGRFFKTRSRFSRLLLLFLSWTYR